LSIRQDRRTEPGPLAAPTEARRNRHLQPNPVRFQPQQETTPHSPQKRSSGSFCAPHDGQEMVSEAPQERQNHRPGRFSAPQSLRVWHGA
jgi:hypothetical protein